jgi:hypothetical protein
VNFDTAKLRKGEIVAAVGAILLFVFLFFFNWYGVGGEIGGLAESFGVDASVSGWDAHSVLRWLMLLTIVVALALAFLTATQRTVALPVTGAVLTTAIAGLTTLLLAYRVLINEPGPNELLDVEIGAILGLIACAVVAYGGFLSMREEGTSIADAREQARAAGSQARAAFDSASTRSDEGTSAAPPAPASEPPVAGTPPPAAPPAPQSEPYAPTGGAASDPASPGTPPYSNS